MASTNPIRTSAGESSPETRSQQLPLNLEQAAPRGPVVINFPQVPGAAHRLQVVAESARLEFWQWQPQPLLWSLAENLAACISAPAARLPRAAWRDAGMLRSARICSEAPASRNPANWGLSLTVHAALVMVALLWPTLADWNPPPRQPTVRELLDQHTVLYYSASEMLPLIAPSPAKEPARADGSSNVERGVPSPSTPQSPRIRLAPARGTQPIVSARGNEDNRRQTIVQPTAPDIVLPSDVEVPNVVAVHSGVPAPPPAAKDYASQRLARLTLPARPEPVPPATPPPAVRKADPAAPQIPAGRIRSSEIQLGRVETSDVPVPQVPVRFRRVPEPAIAPKPAPASRDIPEAPAHQVAGVITARDIPIGDASPARMEDLPTYPVPVRLNRPAAPAARLNSARPMPDAPILREPTGADFTGVATGLPPLVAVSLNAPPPSSEVSIPAGNRSGAFSADSNGLWSQGGGVGESSDLSRAMDELGSRGSSASRGIAVPGLSVEGEELRDSAAIVSGQTRLPGAQPGSADRQLLASIARPNIRSEIPVRGQAPDPFFGQRRVYTSLVNMPNLSSRSGSWVLRFAEPAGQQGIGELSTPQVVRKVDPSYEAGAQRDGVEGLVTLAARVQMDGSIAGVRVVRGLDPRLDLSAISAFTQWRFVPAMRDGRPVELEVLVQIPFAIQ